MKQLRQYIRNLLLESTEYTDTLIDLVAAGEHEVAYDLAESLDIDLDAALLPKVQPIFDQIEQLVHTPSTNQKMGDPPDKSGWQDIQPLLDQFNKIFDRDLTSFSPDRPRRYKGKGSMPGGRSPVIYISDKDGTDMFSFLAQKTGQDWRVDSMAPSMPNMWKIRFTI